MSARTVQGFAPPRNAQVGMRRSRQVRRRGERRSGAKDAPILRLPGRAVDEVSDRWFLIPVEDVAYLFLGSAVLHGLVHSRWNRELRFRSASVYIRSDRGAIFRSAYRSLSEAVRLLDQRFVPAHRSVVVNLDKITAVDLTGRVPLLQITGSGCNDLVSVSRRLLPLIRAQVGFPRRRPKSHRNLSENSRSRRLDCRVL
jgi:hypothetical protein